MQVGWTNPLTNVILLEAGLSSTGSSTTFLITATSRAIRTFRG
jgi:hypothetical protein